MFYVDWRTILTDQDATLLCQYSQETKKGNRVVSVKTQTLQQHQLSVKLCSLYAKEKHAF